MRLHQRKMCTKSTGTISPKVKVASPRTSPDQPQSLMRGVARRCGTSGDRVRKPEYGESRTSSSMGPIGSRHLNQCQNGREVEMRDLSSNMHVQRMKDVDVHDACIPALAPIRLSTIAGYMRWYIRSHLITHSGARRAMLGTDKRSSSISPLRSYSP